MDLLISCLTYLCYDAVCQDADEDQLRENLVSGKYRFLTFASSAWIDLVKQYVRITRTVNWRTPDVLHVYEVLLDHAQSVGVLNALLENMLSELMNPKFQPSINDDTDASQAVNQLSRRTLWSEAPEFIAHSLRFYQDPDDLWTVDNGKLPRSRQ